MEIQLHFALIKTKLENLRLAMCFNDQYLTACVSVCIQHIWLLSDKEILQLPVDIT